MKPAFFRGRKGISIEVLALLVAVAWNLWPTLADDNVPPVDPVAVQPPGSPDASTNVPVPEVAPPVDVTSTAPASATPPPSPAIPMLTAAAQQLVGMAESGLSEDVMLAFVNNSGARFNLSPDQIIYLNDLGVPQAVIKGMIQRDAILAAEPAPAPAVPPTPAMPPPPPDAASVPPPAYITDQSVANQPQDAPPPYSDYDPGDYAASDASSDYFYDSLAPYGSWIAIGGYGRCWRPTICVMDGSWRPYCHGGRWIDTDAGWYWQSDYSWGWAPFHYGRWFFDTRLGWLWQANSVWAPAWVNWRQSPNYCGWAPLPPEAVFVLGRGFRFHHHVVGADFAFGIPAASFNFVATSHLADHAVAHRVLAQAQAVQLFNLTRVSGNITVEDKRIINPGVDPQVVAVASHKEIHKVALRDLRSNEGPTARPDRLDRMGATLTVLRPQVPNSAVRSPVANTHQHKYITVSQDSNVLPRTRPQTVMSAPAPPAPTLPTINRPSTTQFVPPRSINNNQPLIISGPQSRVQGWQNQNQDRWPSTQQQEQTRNGLATSEPNSPAASQNFGYSRQTQPASGYYTPAPLVPNRAPSMPAHATTETPGPPPAPAHIASPDNFSGNHYQPSYSPPPAPAYHAPPAEAAPAYHAPVAESHSAPVQQPQSNSSSSKNH